ncbi:MAG TPA: hypothetical protein VFO65_04960 [Acidimicrobiales bacterium]|nr:hypothetical protein [Acidimicrobiales bacterium]
MSTIWTPGGERPIRRPEEAAPEQARPAAPAPPGATGRRGQPSEEEMEAQMAALQRQLVEAPAAVVIANHCFGMFELAALHLSQRPPKLGEAQIAIDALAAVVSGLNDRLGEAEAQLNEALAQLRLAFVQIRAANLGAAPPPGGDGGGGEGAGGAEVPGRSPA